jgi:arginyl-tRNA synthetase
MMELIFGLFSPPIFSPVYFCLTSLIVGFRTVKAALLDFKNPMQLITAAIKVVVEFSSPNIGKEFDGNHLRSTIIGTYIASLYDSMGWDVVRMNFLGDWGKHIGLLAVGWSKFGSEELFEKEPLRHLVDVYNKIEEIFKPEQEAAKKLRDEGHDKSAIETRGIWAEKDEFFKRMEDGDSDALALWKRFREVCIAKYTDLCARLNISFDD